MQCFLSSAWRFVGLGPEGEYTFYGEYREIAPPERVGFTEILAPFPDAESLVTSVFTEEDGKTRLTVTCLYPSMEVREMVMSTGMTDGAATSYDRLEDLVRELQQA